MRKRPAAWTSWSGPPRRPSCWGAGGSRPRPSWPRAEAELGRVRRAAAPALAAAAEERLRQLAMPAARLEIEVAARSRAGDAVRFLLGANPGEPVQPLARVASGGELARAMLALRLVADRAGRPPWSSTRSTPAWAARRRWRWPGPARGVGRAPGTGGDPPGPGGGLRRPSGRRGQGGAGGSHGHRRRRAGRARPGGGAVAHAVGPPRQRHRAGPRRGAAVVGAGARWRPPPGARRVPSSV